MKFMSVAACCAFLAMNVQAREYSKQYLERKLNSFQKMRTSGIIMGAGGASLTVLGIVLMSTAEYETRTDSYGNTRRVTFDPQWPFGFISVVVGVPAGIAGIVLGGIGAKKVNQYRDLLDPISVYFDLNNERKMIRFAYTF